MRGFFCAEFIAQWKRFASLRRYLANCSISPVLQASSSKRYLPRDIDSLLRISEAILLPDLFPSCFVL
jgi:hypothetical protein